MAFPWGLVLLAAFVLGMQWKVPKPEPQDADRDNNASYQITSNDYDETGQTEPMEGLRIRYLLGKDITEQYKDEFMRMNPEFYSGLEELHKNITAMELDLEAKYSFFFDLWKFIDASKTAPNSSEAFSIFMNATDHLPNTSRTILLEMLKLSDYAANQTDFQMTAPSEEIVLNESTHRVSGGVLSSEMEKSLRFLEMALIAANNSLPDELQESDSLTLTIHVVRTVLMRRTPLTFNDIKPVFVAFSKSSQDISEYVMRMPQNQLFQPHRKVTAGELAFSAITMRDALERLCDIAINLDPRGSLLKSYFEFYLGDKAIYGTEIGKVFERLENVASAVKFC